MQLTIAIWINLELSCITYTNIELSYFIFDLQDSKF